MPDDNKTNSSGEDHFPSCDCMAEILDSDVRQEKAAALEQALCEFNIFVKVVEIDAGPVTTMYEIALAPGVKVSAITERSNDIMRALRAESVRIVAPVPGKSTVRIEVPNAEKEKVPLSGGAAARLPHLQRALEQLYKAQEAVRDADAAYQCLRDEAIAATSQAILQIRQALKEP